MKIAMLPDFSQGSNQPNGISRVVEAYYWYLPHFGVTFTNRDEADLKVVHAGISGSDCDVSILHGLYFTADYPAPAYEFGANRKISEAVRVAKRITVPSKWVAEIIQRDMRRTPDIVPHGIEWQEWQHKYDNAGYVLYNKNRDGEDVCNSNHLVELSMRRKDIPFLSTFARTPLPNIKITGVVPHDQMKTMVQQAAVYASLTKETFGIGVLEAMASGVPVLGFRYGGNIDIVEHGVTGYLANPMDYDDLAYGLDYCLTHRKILSDNAREMAKKWTWEKAVEALYNVLQSAMVEENKGVSVVIPTYNYADVVGRAIQSCLVQDMKPDEIIVVDDGSTDNTRKEVERIISENPRDNITYLRTDNHGVASARNYGVFHSKSKYVCCLDADDEIDNRFLDTCVRYLESHKDVSLAYTSILARSEDKDQVSTWPGEFDYDAQIQRHNQIPTCNVARREVWERLGGQRSRYAPMGQGSEDADMWTRMGAYGMNAAKATNEPLFIYHMSGRTKSREYHEVDWLRWHPWVEDRKHPFASLATPERMSHPVRQYDIPQISVVIPVGPGHENEIINALDSLDAQSFRGWEAIVVWDSPEPVSKIVMDAFPYIRVFHTPHPKSGPGIARNIGVKNARGRLIFFLDADDWLVPGIALHDLYNEWMLTDAIVYSDYFGVSNVSPENVRSFGDRVVDYNERKHELVTRHRSSVYDCVLAQQQPSEKLYHWCLVSCLIPKKYHEMIGGYDEKMPSWEDVDYHWRMAQAGVCYTRVEKPLIVYQFSTGSRRELASADSNRENGMALIEYMHNKYKGVEMSPCPGGCGGSKSQQYYDPALMPASKIPVSDTEVAKVRLNDGNIGDHSVIGAISGTNYGYRASGDVFLMKVQDINAMPAIFQIVQDGASVVAAVQDNTPAPVPVIQSETNVSEPSAEVAVYAVPDITSDIPRPAFDLQSIPGVSNNIASQLESRGINSRESLRALGKEGLMELDGVGEKRASIIMDAVKDD